MSVDDRADDIKQALRFAQQHSRLIIVTGGLGPTDSDVTREAVSEFTGIKLHEDPQLLQHMARRFDVSPDQLRSNLRRQTRVPVRGTYLPNSSGTATGLVFQDDDLVVVALPGPPRELQPMVQHYLIPYLAKGFGVHTIGCALTVRFVGVGQSQIDQTLKDHIRLPADLMQSTQFHAGRVDFTFALPHDTPGDRSRLDQLRGELHKYLGDYIYADDPQTTLEDAVLAPLAARRQSVALAEVGSRGALAVELSQSAIGERVVAGDYVAQSEKLLLPMLEVPRDRFAAAARSDQLSMIATAVTAHTGSDWVIVVGEPSTSEVPAKEQIDLLVRKPDGTLVQSSVPWAGLSPSNRERLVTQLLDYVRHIVVPASP